MNYSRWDFVQMIQVARRSPHFLEISLVRVLSKFLSELSYYGVLGRGKYIIPCLKFKLWTQLKLNRNSKISVFVRKMV